MAQAAGAGLDWIMEVARIYPAAVRYGGAYCSEMVGNASSQLADVLEAMVRFASRPAQGQEILTELMERSRQYMTASGSTFERMLLDFNQIIVQLGRGNPEATRRGGAPRGVRNDPVAAVFRELADLATNEALKLQSGEGGADLEASTQKLEACLTELRQLLGRPAAGSPPRSPSAA